MDIAGGIALGGTLQLVPQLQAAGGMALGGTVTLQADQPTRIDGGIKLGGTCRLVFTFAVVDPSLPEVFVSALDVTPPTLPTLIDVTAPTKPDIAVPDPVTVPPFEYDYSVTVPTMPDIPTFSGTLPADTLGNPAAPFSFADSSYASDLWTLLSTKLAADLGDSTATGLTTSVESGLWSRMSARETLTGQGLTGDLARQLSARGISGAAASSLSAQASQTAASSAVTLARDVALKKAELRLAYRQFVLDKGASLEAIGQAHYTRNEARRLSEARALAEIAIALFNAYLALYRARVERYEAEASVYRSTNNAAKIAVQVQSAVSEAEIAEIKMILARYQADIDLFAHKMRVATTANEILASIFKTDVAAYVAETGSQTKRLRLLAEISQASADISIRIGRVYRNYALDEGQIGVDISKIIVDQAIANARTASEEETAKARIRSSEAISTAQNASSERITIAQVSTNVAAQASNARTNEAVAISQIATAEASALTQLAANEYATTSNIQNQLNSHWAQAAGQIARANADAYMANVRIATSGG